MYSVLNYAPHQEDEEWKHSHIFLTLALDGAERPASCLGCFTPGARWTIGWVGPRASLDVVTEECQSDAARYIDRAIPVFC